MPVEFGTRQRRRKTAHADVVPEKSDLCCCRFLHFLANFRSPQNKEMFQMIDNNVLIASEPTHKKVQRYIIGCLNGKQVYADDPEYLTLVSQVTVEDMPPGNYSGGIRGRLCELQDEMRRPFLDTIDGLTLPELRDRAFTAMVSWQRQVILDRITEASERRKREVEELYRRKRIPGLTKLYDACEDVTDREILLGMIRLWQRRQQERQEAKEERQRFQERRHKAIERWCTATLDDLLADEDRDEFPREWYAAFRPKVVTVAEIAKRLGVSQTTIRKYMPCAPVFVDHYTVGEFEGRKDVTAYYYRPDAEEAVADVMARRRVRPKLSLVG